MADHRDLAAASIHTIGYVQNADPGAIGAGKIWVDTSKGTMNWRLKVRNSANDDWEADPNGDGVGGDGEWFLYNSTTDNTQTELFLDGAALRLTVPNDTTWMFDIHLAARRTDADDESNLYGARGGIDNNAGVVALCGCAIDAYFVCEDTVAWSILVDADVGNSALRVRVTGENAKDIDWKAKVSIVAVTG